jgi:hypothetical protein
LSNLGEMSVHNWSTADRTVQPSCRRPRLSISGSEQAQFLHVG